MTAAPRPLPSDSESLDNGEATGRLQLVVNLGDKRVTVVALESDWKRITEFTGFEADKAVEFAVVQGLQRALGSRAPRNSERGYQVEPTLCGNRVPGGRGPDSWDSLARFVQEDGQYQASRGLRGGMAQDPEQALLGQTSLSDDGVDWVALDEELGKVLRNEAAQDPIGPSNLLAQALSAQKALDQLAQLVGRYEKQGAAMFKAGLTEAAAIKVAAANASV